MADHLRGGIDELLTVHALKAREEEQKAAVTRVRAADVAQMLIASTTRRTLAGLKDGIVDGKHANLADKQRSPARNYIAAVLSLIGEPAANMGHLSTAGVVLARKVNRHNIIYSEVSVALSNVAVKIENSSGVDDISAVTAKTFSPDDITEGTAVLLAQQQGLGHRPQVLGSVSAWVADHEMPDTYLGRERYAEPDKLSKIAQTMLAAMADQELNPDLYTLDFLQAAHPHLAEVALDHSIERPELHEHLILPDWLQSAANAS